MGRLAQATRNAKKRLQMVAAHSKKLRAQVSAEQLHSDRAYLIKVMRKLPRQDDINDLLDEVHARWEPPDPEKPLGKSGGKGKGEVKGSNPRQELLREIVLVAKNVRKGGKQVVEFVKQKEELQAALGRPAFDVYRARIPTGMSTVDQVSEFLALAAVVIALVERYARKMR